MFVCKHEDCEIIFKELSWSNKWVRVYSRCHICGCVTFNSVRATNWDQKSVPYAINPQGCRKPNE